MPNKTRELTKDEKEILVMLQLAENKSVDQLYEKLSETNGGWVIQAIEKRFKAYNLDVDKKVIIMISSLGDGIVGQCVKYVDDIFIWSKKNTKEINWNCFTRRIYPMGIPIFE